MSAVVRPRFFGIVALALSAFVVIAFARTYYLRGFQGLPPLGTLMHLHGAVFTAWLAVFIVQTRLVAHGRVDLHMKLGLASIALAALIVVLGAATAIDAGIRTPIRPSGLTGAQFTIVPLTTITLFAVFVTLGVMLRRRAAAHKRLMVLAMIAVLGPATARLMKLAGLSEYGNLLQILVPAMFVAWCLLADWRAGRGVHRVYVVGGTIIVASWPLRQMVAKSDWWQPIGTWLVT